MPSPAVLLRRSARFAAEPQSAGQARRLLRRALDDAERLQWLEAAALALSELVTNVVLHAHTPFVVVVEVQADRLRVEVRDRSPVLPVPAPHEPDATTGRGLALVSAVTDTCGTHSLGATGKAVWFTLGTRPAAPPPTWPADPTADAEELLAAWADDDTGDDPGDDPGDDLDDGAAPPVGGRAHRDVCLVDLPATLWLAAREHHEALLRELVLYLAEHDDVHADLVRAQDARGHVLPALQSAVRADPAPPPATLTLPLQLPVDLRGAFVELRTALRVGEALAQGGRLLVRPGHPEVVAVREWLLGEVIGQLAGAAPTPWRGAVRAPAQRRPHRPGTPSSPR